MAAIDLVGEGQSFLGENPQVVKVRKVSIGAAASNDVQFDAQETLAIFNVPANTLVLEVLAVTPTAWTALVTLDVGDGTDADGWLATAKVAPTTAVSSGILKSSDLPTAEAFAGGKLYSAADTIDVVIGGATPVVGQTDIYIKYIENVGAI
jgi:hypothetical protein